MKYKTFEEYYKDYPYKYTKAFTESEWADHIYAIWKQKMKEVEPPREYIVVLHSGKCIAVKAVKYMNAKYIACKEHGVKITEIASVL